MSVCLCVYMCVHLGSTSSITNISLNNIDLATDFCIYPFELPHWFYGMQRVLLNETPISNSHPSTLCPILSYHQRCVYCKSDVIFACKLQLCKCLLFILVYSSVLYEFVSVSSNSCQRHWSTLVQNSKLILLSFAPYQNERNETQYNQFRMYLNVLCYCCYL